jgi:uncharacterized protein YjeT (DUF2065 family)
LSTASRIGETARITLSVVRLINGILALFAPNQLGRRLGVATTTSPGLGYAFRLFGVRTILLGVVLLFSRGERRRRAVEQAVLVHGADTAAAITVLRLGELPRNGARLTVGISAANTVLALAAAAPYQLKEKGTT